VSGKRKQRRVYATSRRRRAVVIGACVAGMALLVGLDRGLPTGRGSGRVGRTSGHDSVRYHGKTFAVVRVIDGDTVDIDVADGDAATSRIRLLGIDAPETGGAEGTPAFFATEASAYARDLVEGEEVTVYLNEGGDSRGKYGRLLAYLEMPDGRFLNEVLISEGYVYADLRFRHGYYQRYQQLESGARARGKGLWSEVSPEQWPAWRQRMKGD